MAGPIALATGPLGLELLPFSLRENGVPQLSTYPSFLIAIVFACVGLARQAVYRAANDASGQLRFPAGPDAVALAQSR